MTFILTGFPFCISNHILTVLTETDYMASFNSTPVVSLTNATVLGDLQSLQTEVQIWFTLVSVISATGSLFFVLLLAAFYVNDNSSKSSGLLIVHLTLLEFSVTAVQWPILNTVTFSGLRRIPLLGHIDCHWALFADITTQTAGIWLSFSLSVVRFLAMASPPTYARIAVR